VIPSEVTSALKALSSAFDAGASPPAAPQPRLRQVTGGPGQPSTAADGKQAKAEKSIAEQAARTREEVAQVEQEVAAVQRQVAEAEERAGPDSH
jgi:hypothetical protein